MTRTATLLELAEMIDATLVGTSVDIHDVAPLHSAVPGTITFLTPSSKVGLLDKSRASAAIVPLGFQTDHCPVLQVKEVVPAFEKVVEFFRPKHPNPPPVIDTNAKIAGSAVIGDRVRIDSGVFIGEEVTIADDVTIHAGAVILAGCKIGRGTIIFPNAVLYENTVVGNDCVLHAHCVLGAWGFGYDSSSGRHILAGQWGNVVLEDRVEVGACSTIDRGAYGSTTIGEGTKIDNIVMIGHNCVIGKHNLICAHTGIAGSTTTDDYVVMAGRVGIRDHVHIGRGAVLGAMSGIMADVPDGARVVGIPATPEKEQMKKQVALAKLPEMRKEFRQLQNKVEGIVTAIEQFRN